MKQVCAAPIQPFRFGGACTLLIALWPAAALAAPDLQVTALVVSPTNPLAGSGTLTATFENAGPDDVDLPFSEFTNSCTTPQAEQCGGEHPCPFMFME